MPTTSVRPFRLSIPQSALDDLQTRLRLTRWPDKETVPDWSQGVPLATIQELCEYWQTNYDWRKCEVQLNSYPQFTTTIDGVEIYFLHFRSKHENALPMLLMHGWPGSILEFSEVIPQLIDPESHGGSSEDAFHLVIPALPGYSFSGKPMETGWDIARTARAWTTLMDRLDYTPTSWVAQGGDFGAEIAACLGHQAPTGLKSVHMNSVYLNTKKEAQTPIANEAGVSRTLRLDSIRDQGHYGYHTQQSTRPQTLGYGLADSPVAQAAWIYEKFYAWSDRRFSPSASSHLTGTESKDPSEVLTLDAPPSNPPPFALSTILDTITLYWLTNSGTSSARFYWECEYDTTGWTIDKVPVGVSCFLGDTTYGPREWCERYYKEIVYWNEVERGGHFAAWEVPGLFVGEVRAWKRSLRIG